MPGVAITEAREIPAGRFSPPGGRAFVLPAFCRVDRDRPHGRLRHCNRGVDALGGPWNGKLLGTGNGGFGGAIGYAAMAAGARCNGYATVGTDTGHTGDQLDFGHGHPEKIVDWAYRSIHVMTEAAKLIIRDARGRFRVTPTSTDARPAVSRP